MKEFIIENNYSPSYSLEKMRNKFNTNNNINFLFFWGSQKSKNNTITKSCLSQWWISNFQVDNINYNCMEQYMMSEKARLFNDEENYRNILSSNDPKKIKSFGREVKDFDEKIWKSQRLQIIVKGNYAKFISNNKLKNFILGTKNNILVEASPYDKIWGVGMLENNDKIYDPNLWRGENLLGFSLMEVRDKIAFEKKQKKMKSE